MSLLSIELLYCLCINFSVVVRREGLQWLYWAANRSTVAAAKSLRTGLFFNPEVLRRLKIVSEYRDDFQDLVVLVYVNEK